MGTEGWKVYEDKEATTKKLEEREVKLIQGFFYSKCSFKKII